jgi:hypothetical protein
VAGDNRRRTVWLIDPDGTTPVFTVEDVMPDPFILGNTATAARVAQ